MNVRPRELMVGLVFRHCVHLLVQLFQSPTIDVNNDCDVMR